MINCAYINKLMINTQDYFNIITKEKKKKILIFAPSSLKNLYDLLWSLRWESLFSILNKLHHRFANESPTDLHLGNWQILVGHRLSDKGSCIE